MFFECVSQAYIVSVALFGGLGYRPSDGLQLRVLLRGHIGETPVVIKLQLANPPSLSDKRILKVSLTKKGPIGFI